MADPLPSDPPLFSDDPYDPPIFGSTSNSASASTSRKRKVINPRSEMWEHFTRFMNEADEMRCKCNYYGKEYVCNTTYGTGNLKRHLVKRELYPGSKKNARGVKVGSQSRASQGTHPSSPWRFDQNNVRHAIARMVVLDEYSFSLVDGQGFRSLEATVFPRFVISSRQTVARDCFELFVEERKFLKKFFQLESPRVCLTTDTWTSIQNINYMCVTAHFIDQEWNLQKKILNLCPISSHRREIIGNALEKCLLECGFDKVLTVTFDNATSNDTAISFLKRRLRNWESGAVLNGEFLHMRCFAQIMNLVVQDGLKMGSTSLSRVREAVKYIRQSPARLQKFKSCAEQEKIESKAFLRLDFPTRWNSTYCMLKVAQRFERAFDRYHDDDPYFDKELAEGDGYGRHVEHDWTIMRGLVDMLKLFYRVTLAVLGVKSTTSNSYLYDTCDNVF